MNDLLSIFLNSLFPIFLAMVAGFALGRWLHVNPRSLSQVTFYIFSPCLVFTLITTSHLESSDIVRVVTFAALTTSLVGLAAWVAGRFFCLERGLQAALLLTTMFMNAGNFGLPLNLFAFGDQALAYASLSFITNSVMIYTIGTVVASMGKKSLKESLTGLIKLPAIYALVAALLFSNFGWKLPLPLDRTVSILSQAAVPSMLVLMGLQMQVVRWKGQTGAMILASGLRLVFAPAVALLLASVFGLQGPSRQAGVLEAAMPSAVMSTVLATEFDAEPSFVTAVVFLSTLFSILTLTPLVLYLRG